MPDSTIFSENGGASGPPPVAALNDSKNAAIAKKFIGLPLDKTGERGFAKYGFAIAK
ncbi:MAG: hypothetical protein LBT74_08210 [Acidobacteriota bacterium]|nr:hypothetical protein [Acidobacteriota bacterium]